MLTKSLLSNFSQKKNQLKDKRNGAEMNKKRIKQKNTYLPNETSGDAEESSFYKLENKKRFCSLCNILILQNSTNKMSARTSNLI